MFLIMTMNVLDRLRHGQGIFNVISSPKLIFEYQIEAYSSKKLVDFPIFKVFMSNSLYYNLYHMKLKLITQP